jgi:hypothetical protein
MGMNRDALFLAFVLLAACTILRAQWDLEDSHTTADLRGIGNVGGGVAWASGTNGTVLRTEDGGYLWQTCAIPPGAEHLDFRGIQAFDANTAIVMSSGKGDLSRLYKTTDGCQTWKLVFTNPDAPEGFFDCVHFHREQGSIIDREGFGLLLGDPVGGTIAVFQTRNGGYSWNRISDTTLRTAGADSAAFAASNSCISDFGGATFDMAIGGAAGSFLIGLTYRGHYWLDDASPLQRTWRRQPIPMARGESAGAFSVGERVQFPVNNPTPDFSDLRLHEVIVGGNYQKPDDSVGTAAYHSQTSEGWLPSQTPPHGYRSAVAYDADAKTWITVGPNGTDISTDDGKNWRALHPDAALHEPDDADRNWNALSLPFVVGPHGRIGRLNPHALDGAGRAQ